jgi:cell wall assembly regulator SMI1
MKMADTGLWKSLVEELASDVEFAPGASEAEIAAAEKAIGQRLPNDLRALLLESNGIQDENGGGLIWSCAEIADQNVEFRSIESFRELYMPFDNLLFFGDDGTGDQFAFGITADGKISKNDIYCWDHETDGREYFSGHLRQYLEFRLDPAYYDDDEE